MRCADDGNIGNFGVPDQQIFDLLRIDVHAARNNHETLAVSQEQITVLVDPADIAQCRPAMPVAGLRRAVGVIVIFKRAWPLKIRSALASGGQFVAVLVADMQRCLAHALPDRSRPFEPLRRLDRGKTIPLGPGIIFVDHWPPPFDHRLLDRYRTGRSGVDGDLHRRDIVFGARCLGQFQHPHEMGGHELARVALILLDETQRRLGIEFAHQHDRPAQLLQHHRPCQWCRVIQRRSRQIDAVRPQSEKSGGEHRQRVHRIDGGIDRRWQAYPLGPPRRSARIQHRRARRFIGNRRRGHRGNRVFPSVETRHCPTQAVPRARGPQRGRNTGQIAPRHQQFGPAVGQDIVNLGRGQFRRNGNEPQPAALCAPHQCVIIGRVGQEERHPRLGLQPLRPEHLRDAVRCGVKLGIGHDRAGFGNNDSGLVRRRGGVAIWVHMTLLSETLARPSLYANVKPCLGGGQ